jgi:hypothetical protein
MFSKLKRRSENQVRSWGIYTSPNSLPMKKRVKKVGSLLPANIESRDALGIEGQAEIMYITIP